jgi:general secretion pathway protein L
VSAEGIRRDRLAALHAGWQRWRDSLVSLVPQRVRNLLDGGVNVTALDLEIDAAVLHRFVDGRVSEIARLPRDFTAKALSNATLPYLAKPWFLRDSFALRIRDAAALTRKMSVPLAARRDLASMLDFELDRQSPLGRDEVYHDYRILAIDRALRQIDLDWRIVRRAEVDPALRICRQSGIDVAVVALIGDVSPPDGGTFPVDARAARLLRLRRWMVRGLLLLILGLVAIAILGAYVRTESALAALSDDADQARRAAHASILLENEIAATQHRTKMLVREKQHVPVTLLLAEVTRLLPDGAWLTGFSYHDGELHLQGSSSAAPSLIALFDASPLFAGAEFRSP